MCGRFAATTPPEALARLFGTVNPPPEMPPRWNIAPMREVLAVRFNPATGQRSLDPLRWGLIPHWARDPDIAAKLVNARGESLADKPSFRDAFRRRRCLIPADAFYEWKKGAARKGEGPKQPYAIRMADGRPFAFAGLWENWRTPEGVWLRSCTIVTTGANERLAPLHDRMPVILPPEDHALWLGEGGEEGGGGLDRLQALLRPCPAGLLELYPVGTAVNAVRNDGPALLEPLPSQPEQGDLLGI